MSSGALWIALILTVAYLQEVSSLKCYYCVCFDDCKKHKDQQRTCPAGMNACLTQEGPEKNVVKTCAKDTSGPASGNEGQRYSYCDKDLCNNLMIDPADWSAGPPSLFVPTGKRILMLLIAVAAHTFI